MYRYLLLPTVSLILLLCSCQKEITSNTETERQVNSIDTLASIVFDGSYNGSTSSRGYDSAVLQYTSNSVVIIHYTTGGVMDGSETIGYDGQGRVINYRQFNQTDQRRLNASFSYSGADSLPLHIRDTMENSVDNYTSSFILSNPVATGGLRRYALYENRIDNNNPMTIYTDTAAVWFTSSGKLARYEKVDRLICRYFYNTSSDVDSSIALHFFYGGKGYFTASYTAAHNPLSDFARLIYRNLYPFTVTDQLDNSDFETALNISYLPSELLSVKTPQRKSFWYNSLADMEEFSYVYTVQNNRLTRISIINREVATNVIATSELRF